MNNYPPHFSREEMLFSQTAARNGIVNEPVDEAIEANIIRTAWSLERIRYELGAPIHVSSGYRCPELNMLIGGSKTSAHMQGNAVDIGTKIMTPLEFARFIAERIEDYDQIIHEFGRWVHLGFSDGPPRGQLLTAMKEDGRTVYKHGLLGV